MKFLTTGVRQRHPMATSSTAAEAMRTKPIAVFMAFGTKGDVYPIAAIAAAFASDQRQFEVAFVTHSAHENLKGHLGAKGVAYFPVCSPPVLSSQQHNDTGGSTGSSFSLQKKEITRKHRQESLSIVEGIYGGGPILDGDLIIINFFALEGWSLAELFHVNCVVAAPYLVPYSAPSSFERQFRNELPLLYKYLREAPTGKIGWEDVIHWMWPLFTDDWGTWRSYDLQLSFWPFTVVIAATRSSVESYDPVTGLPTWHERPSAPLLLYGFSQEVVECPEISSLICLGKLNAEDELCSVHAKLTEFLCSSEEQPIFISLSSVELHLFQLFCYHIFSDLYLSIICWLQQLVAESMGYLKNPQAFLRVLENVLSITSHRFILLTAGYGPLDAAIKMFAETSSSSSEQTQPGEVQSWLFDDRLLCFSGAIPYNWLFPRCAAAIHHGGSGSTAAALHAGIPQVICPFILDQFYWAERMFWLGVAPEPLKGSCLLPDNDDDSCILEAANMLVGAINYALSPEVKLHAKQIANRISTEVSSIVVWIDDATSQTGCMAKLSYRERSDIFKRNLCVVISNGGLENEEDRSFLQYLTTFDHFTWCEMESLSRRLVLVVDTVGIMVGVTLVEPLPTDIISRTCS
ncbi:O-mycaminosyltylonolide 6-deoxyallosyltransferase [Sesamum angolense]|uniref:O-mycaminosyltylonolide 6-deoxyallosyltransferase n=1 Tax=Sesamum angolense TaxID=2727404 RepID=A0AAE2BY21_9LAMI|nr:O-mycaminosyltylonolide 6-deoxyallosyltransferase [Sesamum angolense]